MLLGACTSFRPDHKKDEIPMPEFGKATIHGRLISKLSGQPMGNTIVRIGEVFRQGNEGIFLMDEGRSPGARTNADGYFIFNNVEPLEFVIVVEKTEGLYKVIDDGTDKPMIWKVEANQVLDVGVVKIDF